MPVKTYNLKTDSNTKLSTNFTVKEFKCNDGTTVVKIDTDNVKQLQKIRDHFKKSITITSGYRTPAYNTKIGGASSSYHTKGKAADIVVKDVNSRRVAMYAEAIGCKGVIWYPIKKFTHVDTRPNVYHAICVNNSYYPEPSITLKHGSAGSNVKWLQYMLNQLGYKTTVDGVYGAGTKLAVKDFQSKSGLTNDGIFGAKTKEALKKALS